MPERFIQSVFLPRNWPQLSTHSTFCSFSDHAPHINSWDSLYWQKNTRRSHAYRRRDLSRHFLYATWKKWTSATVLTQLKEATQVCCSCATSCATAPAQSLLWMWVQRFCDRKFFFRMLNASSTGSLGNEGSNISERKRNWNWKKIK